MLALVSQKPQLLNLKELIQYFIFHRREVIYKRTLYELNRYKDKLHIMEGIIICLFNIDKVINFIKKSDNIAEAKRNLKNINWFTEKIHNIFFEKEKKHHDVK